MRRFLSTLVVAGVLSALGISQAQAIPFTYQYQGNTFTDVSGLFTTSDAISGQFTVDLPSNQNLPLDIYTGAVTAFSFTDGLNTFTEASPLAIVIFAFSTNGSGAIVDWGITLQQDFLNGMTTQSILGASDTARNFSRFRFSTAGVFKDPGRWTRVPEPMSLALLGFGVLALGLLVSRRRSSQRVGHD